MEWKRKAKKSHWVKEYLLGSLVEKGRALKEAHGETILSTTNFQIETDGKIVERYVYNTLLSNRANI